MRKIVETKVSTGTGDETITVQLPYPSTVTRIRAINADSPCKIYMVIGHPSLGEFECMGPNESIEWQDGGVKKVWEGAHEISDPNWYAKAHFDKGDKAATDSLALTVIVEDWPLEDA